MTAPAAVATPEVVTAPSSDPIDATDSVIQSVITKGYGIPAPEQAASEGAAATDAPAESEAATTPTGSDAPATPDATPATPPDAPSQEDLAKGVDVGTGDALFRVRDPKSGQFVAPPEVTIELAMRGADGEMKVYQKTPSELARMARDGIAGQRAVNELQRVKPEVDTLRAQLEQQMELNRSILNDPTGQTLEALRQQWAQLNAPETVLSRREAELARREQELARTEQRTTALSFAETRILPVIRDAEAALGSIAVAGYIAIHGPQPDAQTGVVAPAVMADFVNGPLKAWVAQEKAKTPPPATSAAPDPRAQAQKAVNRQAQSARPVGAVAPDAPAVRKADPNETIEQRMQRIIGYAPGGVAA